MHTGCPTNMPFQLNICELAKFRRVGHKPSIHGKTGDLGDPGSQKILKIAEGLNNNIK